MGHLPLLSQLRVYGGADVRQPESCQRSSGEHSGGPGNLPESTADRPDGPGGGRQNRPRFHAVRSGNGLVRRGSDALFVQLLVAVGEKLPWRSKRFLLQVLL